MAKVVAQRGTAAENAIMIDFVSLARPRSSNTYLLAPEGLCTATTPDGPAPVFDATAEAVFSAARAEAEALPGSTDVQMDEQRHTVSFVDRTRLMRFKDDVAVLVVPQGDRAAMAIYSRSRIGKSDLGKNKQRVEAFVGAVRARLAA